MNHTRPTTSRRQAVHILAVAVMIGAPFLGAAAHPAPGEQRRWALNFRTRLEQTGSARPVEIALSGDWTSTVSAVRTGEYDAELQLANLRLATPKGPTPADQLQAFERRLQRPFWATYRGDGLLLAIHFYKDTDPGDRNLLQMIATECQFVNAAQGASWTVRERDGAGEYEASYSRLDANTVTKRKVKYAAGTPIAIDQSDTRIHLDGDAGITRLDSSFRAHIHQLTVITEVHLAGLRRSAAPETAGNLARAHADIVSSPIGKHQVDPELGRARLDAQLLEGRSTESLLGVSADPLQADRLAALFRQRPEAASLAVEQMRKTGPSSLVMDALGTAGSPGAIQALAGIARDRTLPRVLRIDALSAFIQMQKPAVEAMRAPSALWDDSDRQVAAAARMGSGSLARAGRASHPQEAANLDAALVARYQKAGEEGERVELLAAMGNSAGKLLEPAIEGALRDPKKTLRAAAARALRLVPGAEVEGLLAATIAGDRDAEVRAAAIFAATFRKPIGGTLRNALLRAATADSVEQVRTSAITLLGQQRGPQVEETLTWIAAHDPITGVRHLAQETLTGLPNSTGK